jgi:hypothetical protein
LENLADTLGIKPQTACDAREVTFNKNHFTKHQLAVPIVKTYNSHRYIKRSKTSRAASAENASPVARWVLPTLTVLKLHVSGSPVSLPPSLPATMQCPTVLLEIPMVMER